jgi:hypothetical protein
MSNGINLRTILITVAGGISALMPAHVQAQGAPSGLYGKSIVLTWSENRSQRLAGSGAPFKMRSIGQSLSIYVSSQGRLFNRRNATNPKGHRGKKEGIGGNGRTSNGGLRNTRFHGDNLVVAAELAGGARLITASFAGNFSSCTATIRVARETGRHTMQVRSLVSGEMIEIESVSATNPTCSVREGNVFGGR